MSGANPTKEALSIVDKLKVCILKQDQIIRRKDTEINALQNRVALLEKERAELKRQLLNEKGVDLTAVNCAIVDLGDNDTRTRETNQHSSSPTIVVTSENTSPSRGSLKSKIRETSVKRNNSINRTKSISKKYELSPDLQERSVMLLERKYGSKEKAHHAATVIQSYYRKYTMDKRFKRIKAYSDTPEKTLQSEVPHVQTTPVIRLVKKHAADRNNRVRSTLIIDNISPYTPSGQMNLATHFESVKNEEKPAMDDGIDDEGQTVSVTENYMKVEVVDRIAKTNDKGSVSYMNGEIPRSQKLSTTSLEEGDEVFGTCKAHDNSSVDSIDGVCASHTDEDNVSVSSEFETIPTESLKPQKLEMRIGINHFNRKPEKGIDYLISHQVIEDSADLVAKFLISEHGISKQRLGEYLGNIQNDFNMAVLKCFTENLDFTGMEIDVALRLFLSYFRIPGEAQKIERLMEMFSEQYLYCNPTDDKGARDKVLILAFAIVMLNTDLHSPNVKKKMAEQDFIRNLEGTNDGGNFPPESLSGIYRRILKKEFTPARDHVTMTIKLEKKIVGKMPWTSLAAPHRYLRMTTQLYEVQEPHKRDKIHARILFLFNDLLIVTKERGKSGQRDGFHFYSYKTSFPLVGVKISLFNNDYYLYGIQLYSRIQSKILATFNASDEPSRKMIVEELMECIDETNTMESDRITTEKQKQFVGRFERNPGTMTLPHPKKNRGKAFPADDTISLNEESMSTTLSSSSLVKSRHLSSSMLNMSDGDISFSSESEGIKRCNSSSSLDSAFVDGDSTRSNQSPHNDSLASASAKGGIFKKWRKTKTLSRGAGSPQTIHKTLIE